MQAVWGQMKFLLIDWMTFCATRVVRDSINPVSFTMFTGASILLASNTVTMAASEDCFDASNTVTMAASEDCFDDTRTPRVTL